MPPFRLVIPRHIHEEMLRHARTILPNECCGLLAGVIEDRIGSVREHYPLVNELQSPVAYQSEARGMFAAMKAMRAAGTGVLAIYHSHPSSPAVPSGHDLAQNYSESVMNLIISFASDPPHLLAWWLTETNYTAADWEIGD